MAVATASAEPVARRSTDWLFLAAALLVMALLIAFVLIDDQPYSAALLALGFGLGAAFLNFEFSFTASWRRFLVRGEAGGLLAPPLRLAYIAADDFDQRQSPFVPRLFREEWAPDRAVRAARAAQRSHLDVR